MASQPKQKYSAQNRESQYDPDVDANLYIYQQQQQQQQQQHRAHPRSSRDNNPAASTSKHSSASTILDISSSNGSSSSSSNALQDSAAIGMTSAPPSSTSVASSSSSSRPPSGAHTTTTTASHSSGSAPIVSRPSIRILNNHAYPSRSVSKSKSKSSQSLNSRPELITGSTIVPRGSISSLQRSHSASTSQRVGNGAPLIAPVPRQPSMAPVFMMDYQSQQTTPMTSQEFGHGSRIDRSSSASTIMNRQDDGRLRLEQEREYHKTRKWRTWTKSKALLLLANTILLTLSIVYTDIMIMSWKGDEWTKQSLDSDIMMVADRNLLYLMTATPLLGIVISIIGYIGIFAQSRKILTVYTVLLWPLFALLTTIGYMSFRRNQINLYQKLKVSWINEYSRDDRLVIQNALSCCGFRSVNDFPSYDLHCFPGAPRPSCDGRFLRYQQNFLSDTSNIAFQMVPVQILVMIAALLCSNHIDNMFRTAYPITPKFFIQ